MKTNMFWQGLSCVALIAALAVAVVHVTSARPARAAGGGAAGGIIALTEVDGGDARLYLIDTNRKVLLVYGSYRQKDRFYMLAGRYFEYDLQATVGTEKQFRGQGYPALLMKREADKKRGSRGPN